MRVEIDRVPFIDIADSPVYARERLPMKCPSCQTENLPDSRFCHKCATPFPDAVESRIQSDTRAGEKTPGPVAMSMTRTLITPFEDLARGMIFADRYEVIEEIGRGGMGKVYKVYDRTVNEVVALKLIKPEIGFNEKAVERFRNELKFARKISHRHVCRLYDLGETGLVRYITMEYVEGEDLKHFIRRAGHLNTAKAVAIVHEVCEGLSEAHRLGVVHRDLKPQNIMIDRDGRVRIMDFGLARFSDNEGVTGSGIILGTPEYMSPEQIEMKDVDARSDIYSLGIIMYEMVTGRVPFEGETPLSVAIKHKSSKPPDSREINPLVPESFSRLIFKCLEKDRDQRFQSAEELLASLDEVADGLPSAELGISRTESRRGKTRALGAPGPTRRLVRIGASLIAVLAVAIVALQLVNIIGDTAKIRSSRRTDSGPAGTPEPPAAPLRSAKTDTHMTGKEAFDAAGQSILKVIESNSPQAIGAVEKTLEGLRVYVPEKGPYRDALSNALNQIGKEKARAESGAPIVEKTRPDVRTDMQKLLSLVAERQAAQQAKDLMLAAKARIESRVNPTANLLFRLARFEEANADEAFAKNDYSGSKSLYTLLEKVYPLCPQAANDKDSISRLQTLSLGLKKAADAAAASDTDPWLAEYAGEIEKEAAEYLTKGDMENAGGALLRAAFLYEKILDAASPGLRP
jgi:serine/threonine protein kinase